ILKATSRHAARDVLASLESTKPKLAAAVREHLFQFEDLPQLAVGLRRRLVATLDVEDLAKALVGADAAIVTSISDVLSRRLERILREEQRAVGDDVPEADIEHARERLQRALHDIEDS
ncbi:MAG: hypothetical protein KAI47_09445, partial [Deltaproteobacteria bacterium]|nr:hypothetical protein [Deltaproteobacteria bacterium]